MKLTWRKGLEEKCERIAGADGDERRTLERSEERAKNREPEHTRRHRRPHHAPRRRRWSTRRRRAPVEDTTTTRRRRRSHRRRRRSAAVPAPPPAGSSSGTRVCPRLPLTPSLSISVASEFEAERISVSSPLQDPAGSRVPRL
jgi:hypothetical protein